MKNKLVTPMDEITILVDDVEIQYTYIEGDKIEHLCPDVIGRFQIETILEPDGKHHTISCLLPSNKNIKRDGESGERLECTGFYHNNMKLSIGTEGEVWSNYMDSEYDYDIDYLDYGMQYVIVPETKTKRFVFGISWIDNVDFDDCSDEAIAREVQTWYGADPTLSILP